MTESLPSADLGAQKRRSTRIEQAVPITVTGVDALGQPFKERTTTTTVNCHGCKYQSKHYVPKNSNISIEIPRPQGDLPARVAKGRVVWVQRPRTVRELFQIGVEFEVGGNVWGIAFPPEDWFPCAGNEAAEPAAAEEFAFTTEDMAAAPDAPMTEKKAEVREVPLAALSSPAPSSKASAPQAAPPQATKPTAPASPPATGAATPASDARIHVVSTPAPMSQDMQLAVARQIAKMVSEAKDTIDKTLRKEAQTAITEEMSIVRIQLDAQLHETVERAIKSSMERVSESEVRKVLQAAADRTTAIVEQARKTSEQNAAQMDARVRQAVQEASSIAAQQTAREADQQAAERLASMLSEARRATEDSTAQVDEKIRAAIQDAVLKAKETLQEAARNDAERSSALLAETQQLIEAKTAHIEAYVRQAVQEASGSAVQQATQDADRQTAERLTSLIEETRKAAEASASLIDEKIRQAMQEASGTARQLAAEATQKSAEAGGILERVQQANQHATAILDQARLTTEASAAQIDAKIRETVQQTVGSAAEQAARQAAQWAIDQNLKPAVEEAVGRVISEREASSPSLQILSNPEAAQNQLEQWKKRLEESAHGVRDEALEQSKTDAEAVNRRWQEELDAKLAAALATMSDRLTGVSQAALTEAEREIGSRRDDARRAIEEVTAAAQATAQALRDESEQERLLAASAKAELQEVSRATVEQARQRLEPILAGQIEEAGRRADQIISERAHNIEPILQNLEQRVIQNVAADIERVLTPKVDEAQRLASDLRTAGEQTQALSASVREELRDASEGASQIQQKTREQIQRAMDEAERKVAEEVSGIDQQVSRFQTGIREEIRQASEEAAQAQTTIRLQMQQSAGAAARQAAEVEIGLRDQLSRASEQTAQIQNSLRIQIESVAQEAVQKAVSEMASVRQQTAQLQVDVRQQIQQAADAAIQQAFAQVATAREQAARIENSLNEQIQRASEQASLIASTMLKQAQLASEQVAADSLERLKQEVNKYPVHFETTCREILSKLEKELDERSSDTQHQTFEALSKAADWHQKKAQTTMNTALERVLEQSSAALERRAGDVSSMVASELDHYRRSYVEHSQAEMQELAKEIVDQERGRLAESGEIANATFTDRVNRTVHDSLRQFEEASRATAEKMRSDAEYEREKSFAKFQKKLDEQISHGVEQGQTFLQAQMMPMIEAWAVDREAEKLDWTLQLQKTTEESLDTYKVRLENATNSWLVASATMLGQNSQAVIDALAKAAEARLRETCGQVLAGMGDVLKERLRGISTGFHSEPDDFLKHK